MKRLTLPLLIFTLCFAQEPKRPRITGLAHVAFYATDLEKTRSFYKDFLGYEEVYKLKAKDGSDNIAFIKINEKQYVELFTDKPRQDGQLNHISVETDDAEGMRSYLAARGVKVPQKVGKGRIGNSNFNITDPDGHTVEIVQYEPDGWTVRDKGKAMPETRISTHMMHGGIVVGPLEPALKFYGGILGFQEFWRGGGNPKELSWVNLRVPDGVEYFEFMLYGKDKFPQGEALGVRHHICLITPDIEKAVAILESRRGRAQYTRPIEIRTGVNRKRQANLFDPDGTRVELMEPDTIDGKPTPPSTAPPPQ